MFVQEKDGTIVRKKIQLKWKKIQERALRFIYEDYDSSYEDLLHINPNYHH